MSATPESLREFVAQLRATHQQLAVAFEAAQHDQREATKRCKHHRDALVAFRREFGGHLKAAEEGVTVAPEEG